MKRFLTTLSIVFATVTLGAGAIANEAPATREAKPQTEQSATSNPPQVERSTATTNDKQLARTADQANTTQTPLSERDRLTQQYHLQQVIPAQE